MGEIEVKGPQALDLVQHTTPNDASRLVDGRPSIPRSLRPRGTFVDDILVHGSGLIITSFANASNSDKDAEWLSRAHGFSG
jgi:aminomethyltransferase